MVGCPSSAPEVPPQGSEPSRSRVAVGLEASLCHCMLSPIQPSPRDLHSLALSWDGSHEPHQSPALGCQRSPPHAGTMASGGGKSHPMMSHKAPQGAGDRPEGLNWMEQPQ